MNLKAITISVCCLSISACQHSDSSSAQEQKIPSQPQVQLPAQPKKVIATYREPVTNYNNNSVVLNKNLLDRIRNGFRFPELDSKYISEYEKWNSTHPTYLTNLFKRSEPFLFHIVEEIERRGLPMELALLPAIESAYKPTAVSRSKAVGLWQFLHSTGKDFGLNKDWWFDGRRDVLLSTNAALDYLTQLNSLFDGDWFLTLAAYNAGQGTVGRAIKANKRKGKKANYTSLSLRSETRRYVPKIIALKNIINNPYVFNVDLPQVNNYPQFEVITTAGQIDIEQFSRSTSIDVKTLKNLNSGFLRNTTPPSGPHRILVPTGNEQALLSAGLAVKNTVKTDYQHHTITRGETLSGIARRYGVSVSELKTKNKLRSNSIRAGKQLLVPFGGHSSNLAVSPSSKNTTQQKVHHVRQGDTLWGISRKYGVQISELVAWNQLSRKQILKLNQPLVVFPN